ncbi:MAG: T9SS type A sorting domain-containing protein [candidate division Zixibacteria bacterium]|nr:T9SS type A sorting domain-containing protein [candidate division Zixibacteria bacterium]
MRIVRISLLSFLLVVALAGGSQVQAQIGCDDLTKSAFDILRIPFFCGIPGDTVLLPVILEHDSIVTSFQFLIEFDTAWLRPVYVRDSSCAIADSTGCISWNIDTTYVDHLITGRMLKTDTTSGEFGPIIDTINQFTVNMFQGHLDILACNAVPEFLTLDSLPPGDDTIFYVKMIVNPAMPHLQLTALSFHESDIFTVVDTVFPPDTTWYNGCNNSQMVTAWRVGPDSTAGYQIYPTTDLGYTFWFQADTACVPNPDPPTVALTANPTSFVQGGQTTLSWISTYADSVVVRDQGGTRLSGSANGNTSGSLPWSSSTLGTYTFTATAYGDGTASDGASVTVTAGSANCPSITVVGNTGIYDQGELISFTVTATNISGTQISINATSLPSNASFGTGGSVVGVSPVSGTFSWTPDFNQKGSFSIRFTATDSECSIDRYEAITVNELQFDRLFSTSREGNRPVGGLPGREGIFFPIDLVTSQTVYGVQFDMFYPNSVIRIDSFVTTARIPEYVVYDNIGVTPGEIRVVTFGLNNEPVNDTNTTAILQAVITLDSSAVPWTDYTIHLENGRESISPDPGVGSLPLVTDSGLIAVDSLGDVNLDRHIDVADAVNIVAYIINTYTLSPRQFEVADIITNDSVNVFDLVADVNMIYGVPLPSPAAPVPGENAVLALDYGDVPSGSSSVLTVRSEIPREVAGFQLQLNYDPTSVSFGTPSLTQDNAHYALHANDDGQGRLKILIYNFASYDVGEFMQPGVVDLVEIPITAYASLEADDKTKIRLTEALLSTAMAGSIAVQGVDAPLPTSFTLSQNYPNPFNPSTIIEFSVGAAENGASQHVRLDVFNILGQEVTTLMDGSYSAGDYQVVWDATDKSGRRVATGIYLYRLKVGDERKTKKMLFLK